MDASQLRRAVRRHRSVVTAVVILAVSIGLTALDLDGAWGFPSEPFGPNPWWGMLTVVPGCVLVALSGRAPLAALTGGAVLFAIDLVAFGTAGMLLVIFDLLYVATMRLSKPGRLRLLAVIIAIGVVGVLLAAVLTRELRLTVFVGLLVFVTLGTPFWWAMTVRQAQDLAELQAERAADAARMAELRERDAVREERERMARDLHDVIAGHLSAVALRSEGALARDPDEDRDRAALAAIRSSSVRSLEEMRTMILLLRAGADPAVAADRLDRLDDLAAEATASGLEVTVEFAPLPELPTAVDQAAARIVREALRNAAKHAGGGRVAVAAAVDGGTLRVDVRSWGGAPRDGAAPGLGIGIATLRERAEALGGRLDAGPTGDGWTVAAELPLAVRG